MRKSNFLYNYAQTFASPYTTEPMTHSQHLIQDYYRPVSQLEKNESEICLAEHHFDNLNALGKRPFNQRGNR